MPRWTKTVGFDACCEPETVGATPLPRDDDANETLATVAKALGHPSRVNILRMLLTRDRCVCGDVVDRVPFAQSTVSQHLKVLKDAGLVRGEIAGQTICYCANLNALFRLRKLLDDLLETVPVAAEETA